MNNIQKNRLKDQIFKIWGIGFTLFGLVILFFFIGDILIDGIQRIDWSFITDLPSRKAEKSGNTCAFFTKHLDFYLSMEDFWSPRGLKKLSGE